MAKLPASEQERWHQDRTSPGFREDPRKLGEKFLAWLERQGAAANSARLTQQALTLTKQPLIPPPYAEVRGVWKRWPQDRKLHRGRRKGEALGARQGARLVHGTGGSRRCLCHLRDSLPQRPEVENPLNGGARATSQKQVPEVYSTAGMGPEDED